ncbi:hypothetical protein ACLMJK_003756 [Lecanora helva]
MATTGFESASQQPIVQLIDKTEKPRSYDRASSTRYFCLCGLGFTWLLFIGGVIAIIVLATKSDEGNYTATLSHPATGTVVLPLVFAVVITVCNECLGIIHTTSLRWSLWREGRLSFNTNLRLFTRSRSFAPNAWYSNFVCVVLSALSYAAAGQLISVDSQSTADNLTISIPALASLFIGLSGQAAIATWALSGMKRQIPTWSSGSINNSLALHQHSLAHEPGYSLTSYDKTRKAGKTVIPSRVQPSLGSSRRSAVLVTICQWTIALATIIWSSVIIANYSGVVSDNTHSSFLHRGARSSSDIAIVTNGRASSVNWVSTFVAFGIQLPFTFTLHCTELLVNASRDERAWRRSAKLKSKGARMDTNAIKDACTSWETITLFVLKSLVHWGFGEAVEIQFSDGDTSIDMWANSLYLLSAFTVIVAVFGTYLCYRRPKGPQPVAWGHFQTLVNLIDDWGSQDQPLYWGDKGHVRWVDDGEVRRAGTAGTASGLSAIHMNASYY